MSSTEADLAPARVTLEDLDRRIVGVPRQPAWPAGTRIHFAILYGNSGDGIALARKRDGKALLCGVAHTSQTPRRFAIHSTLLTCQGGFGVRTQIAPVVA